MNTKVVRPRSSETAAAVRTALCDPYTYGTTLLVLCLDEWGGDLVTWAPATIIAELDQRFAVPIPQGNIDRLMAAITVVTTDLFFKSLPAFNILANILAGDELDPDQNEIADSAECAWAITEALLLNPPDDDEADGYFADDIRTYIGAILRDEGYVTPPDILRIALDADFARTVDSYADDPDLFSAIWKTQQAKTDDINQVIRMGLQDLVFQLKSLPLRNGSTKELELRLAEALRRA